LICLYKHGWDNYDFFKPIYIHLLKLISNTQFILIAQLRAHKNFGPTTKAVYYCSHKQAKTKEINWISFQPFRRCPCHSVGHQHVDSHNKFLHVNPSSINCSDYFKSQVANNKYYTSNFAGRKFAVREKYNQSFKACLF
jgi:hypothetical protein